MMSRFLLFVFELFSLKLSKEELENEPYEICFCECYLNSFCVMSDELMISVLLGEKNRGVRYE